MKASLAAPDSALLVFTSRDQLQLEREGGSQAWALDVARARRCTFLVCSWNQYGNHAGNQKASHGEGFLVARIDAIQPAPEDPKRAIIRFSEWAPIAVADLWGGWRNPVKYTSLGELGIEIDELQFHHVSERSSSPHDPDPRPQTAATSEVALNIFDAKRALAAFYQVPLEGVEITIRG